MVKLSFLDLKTKKKFNTDKFTVKKLTAGRRMAVAKTPSGGKATRFLAKNFKG